MARSPWGPGWDEVAPILGELGWGDATALREVREGGYSPASRWIVERSDGTRAFVKAKAGESPDRRLEAERAVSQHVHASCLPRLHAAHLARRGTSVLVFEDLSGARWGTPLSEADARSLRVALDELSEVEAPSALQPLEPHEAHDVGWWHVDADAFERLGLGSPGWLARHAGELHDAARSVTVAGPALVHDDLWLQNWCRAGRGAVLVDWAGAALGNPRFNHAWGEAGIRAAGGPAGQVLGPDDPDHAGWAAYMAGLAASFVLGDLEHVDALPRLHATQAREAMATLTWAAEALELEPPTFAPALSALGTWMP